MKRYCRFERRKRKLNKSAARTPKITSYFPILNQIEVLINENAMLRENLRSYMETKKDTASDDASRPVSKFLHALYDTAKINAGKKKGGKRYSQHSDTLKKFAAYLFVLGGRKMYETLHSNLNGALPSITSVQRIMSASTSSVTEGEFRFSELKTFLVKRQYPLKVWVSEDATRITGKVQYDRVTNLLVGLVLPLNSDEVPRQCAFPATSAKVIQDYYKHETAAGNAYCIMAQPLVNNAPAFCLSLYGTDNKFTYKDVLNKWDWMMEEAAKVGIQILGFSSDGDPKLLKAMQCRAFATDNEMDRNIADIPRDGPHWDDWFLGNPSGTITYVQDHIHIATKLRTRLLKPSIVLPMGQYLVSPSHLKCLIAEVSKDQHMLTPSDLEPKDKMNFRAMEKVWDERVTQLLKERVVEAKATVTYLEMARLAVSSFTDRQMTPLLRIQNIWQCVFFLRLWKQWLKDSGYSATANFITGNTYICLELNAHALVQMVRYLRETDNQELWKPWLWSSQPCESFFRSARSMTSTYSTIINFSMLGFLHRVRRIDLQNDVSQTLDNTGFRFPRNKRATLGPTAILNDETSYLPIDEEIERAISLAREHALRTAEGLNMQVLEIPTVSSAILSVSKELPAEVPDDDDNGSDVEAESIIDDLNNRRRDEGTSNKSDIFTNTNLGNNNIIVDDDTTYEDMCIISSDKLSLKTFDDKFPTAELPENSPFVQVAHGSGKKSIIKKSTLCWMLSSGTNSLSSDRLHRVKAPITTLTSAHDHARDATRHSGEAMRDDTVSIGDWCAFRSPDGNALVGRILAFSYLSGKGKSREFSASSAPVQRPNKKGKGKGLGCLCSWFSIEPDGKLIQAVMDYHGYYEIENYICTVPKPAIKDSHLYIDINIFNFL